MEVDFHQADVPRRVRLHATALTHPPPDDSAVNEAEQAGRVMSLWNDIVRNLSALDPGNAADLGKVFAHGFVFGFERSEEAGQVFELGQAVFRFGEDGLEFGELGVGQWWIHWNF